MLKKAASTPRGLKAGEWVRQRDSRGMSRTAPAAEKMRAASPSLLNGRGECVRERRSRAMLAPHELKADEQAREVHPREVEAAAWG